MNLAVAVKELVENSVDAGAKIVEIKIRNFGADGFDVVDNGRGIEEENFVGITAKHHTSKLKEFSDLESIKTFGFRGEALSSLCALSNVTITTRHSSTEHGTRLTFDHDGAILKKAICARNVGTTVGIADFFVALPVRRGEFLKNYKKDFGKMVQLIQEYCLVLTGVKIICTNQPANGARQTVLSTNGSSVMENIISIFGAKQAKDLIKVKSPTEDGTEDGSYTQQSLADLDSSSSVLDIKQPELDSLNLSRFKIEGFISNIDHSCGRSSKDRQYFYINSRPVELKAISKLANDVYHRYNLKQFPFIYLNLKMDQSGVDVNLSKDKRQVAVCNDKILQLAVKRSLLNTYGELPSKFKFVSVNNSVKKFATSDGDESDDGEDKIMVIEPGNKFAASLKQWRVNPSDPTPASSTSNKRKSSKVLKGQKQPKIFFHQAMKEIEERKASFDGTSEKEKTSSDDVSFRIDCKTRKSENTLRFEVFKPSEVVDVVKTRGNVNEEEAELVPVDVETVPVEVESAQIKAADVEKLEESFLQMSEPSEEITAKERDDGQETTNDDDAKASFKVDGESFQISDDDDEISSINVGKANDSDSEVIFIDTHKPNVSRQSSRIKISLNSIRSMAKAEEEAFDKLKAEKKSRKLKLRFKETIDPSKNNSAEAELETEIKKDMFSEMEVLGQFNLGFIIAKLNSDLFIVDQHASDEKFNFEHLQKTIKLQTQPLVVPEKLELTAIQEMTLIENLKVFEMNGFRFLIDHDAEAGKKIRIHSKPHSKNWEFGKEDIEEMIFMLDDAPNTICRPSRIRTMLASRACRKSVMIGDALTKKQMKKLVDHMGELDHPWVSLKS